MNKVEEVARQIAKDLTQESEWKFYAETARAAIAAMEKPTEGMDIPRLPIGTPVRKVIGYPFPGEVRAAFTTISGNERFVVEATGEEYRGMLHIFNGDQLRALSKAGND